MKYVENGEVNDIFAFVKDFDSTCYADACHYTDTASQIIADEVARVISNKF